MAAKVEADLNSAIANDSVPFHTLTRNFSDVSVSPFVWISESWFKE